MKMKEKVLNAVNNFEFDNNNQSGGLNELIAYAYYMGRHDGVAELSDKVNSVFAEQLERAEKSRYKHLCRAVQGDVFYIYNSDYSDDFVKAFADDKVNL